jgi:hypothetical protein
MAEWIASSKTDAATAEGKELFPTLRSPQLRVENLLVRDCATLWTGKKIQEDDTNRPVSFKDLTGYMRDKSKLLFRLFEYNPTDPPQVRHLSVES